MAPRASFFRFLSSRKTLVGAIGVTGCGIVLEQTLAWAFPSATSSGDGTALEATAGMGVLATFAKGLFERGGDLWANYRTSDAFEGDEERDGALNHDLELQVGRTLESLVGRYPKAGLTKEELKTIELLRERLLDAELLRWIGGISTSGVKEDDLVSIALRRPGRSSPVTASAWSALFTSLLPPGGGAHDRPKLVEQLAEFVQPSFEAHFRIGIKRTLRKHPEAWAAMQLRIQAAMFESLGSLVASTNRLEVTSTDIQARVQGLDARMVDGRRALGLFAKRLSRRIDRVGRALGLEHEEALQRERDLRTQALDVIWKSLESIRGDLSEAKRLRDDPLEAAVEAGAYVWTAHDVRLALDGGPPGAPTIERGEHVDIAALRHSRAVAAPDDFGKLSGEVDAWIARSAPRKRTADPLRILWVDAPSGPHRGAALLACLGRVGNARLTILDVGSDIGRAAATLEALRGWGDATGPVIGLEVNQAPSREELARLANAIVMVRKRRSSESTALPRLVVAGDTAVLDSLWRTVGASIECDAFDLDGLPRQRPHSFHGAAGMTSDGLGLEDVFNRGLPITASELIGREDDIAALDAAWRSDDTQIFTIVAYGGVGKSALVNDWLAKMRGGDYRGARKVFAWSFYSQGTKEEGGVSADEFVDTALWWLGDRGERALNAWTRGLQLARLVRQHKLLLVLDGLEPLQHAWKEAEVGGQLKDDSIRALFESLAQPGWDGLCIVTTRVPVTDLENLPERTRTVDGLELDVLGDEDGAKLIASLGVKGERRRLRAASYELGGHPLALTLLANYLRDVHRGDLTGIVDLPTLALLGIDASDGGHARRVMKSYALWLEKGARVAELEVLRVIGLFDRPARPAAMAALLAEVDLDPFTSVLDSVGSPTWNRCVEALRGMGLLSKVDPNNEPGTIDAHPLVREHFRDVIRSRPGQWERGNRRLYAYYATDPSIPRLPEDAKAMSGLYAAVTHGTAAGLHQRVFDEILLPRIWRDRSTNYSTRNLGLTGSDLVALANYFVRTGIRVQWTRLRDVPLTPDARVLVLTNAGVRLRQLGRLAEARECFGAVVREVDATIGEWLASGRPATNEERQRFDDASYAMAQHCELLVVAGELKRRADEPGESALESGQRAIDFATRGAKPYFKMHARTSLAEVFFMLGEGKRAGELLEEARSIDREKEHPQPRYLYSQGLYRHGYFMIESGRADELLLESVEVPGWGEDAKPSLLSEAIRACVLGAAHRALVEQGDRSAKRIEIAGRTVDESVDAFRTAGYSDYIVRGLCERAHFLCVRAERGDYERAIHDLDVATSETKRGRMNLLYAEVLLRRASCYLRFESAFAGESRERLAHTLREAREFVVRTSYGRRRKLVDDLLSSARERGVDIERDEKFGEASSQHGGFGA